MKESSGTKTLETHIAAARGSPGTVELIDNIKIVSVNQQEFLSSLINNIWNRMFTTRAISGTANDVHSQSTPNCLNKQKPSTRTSTSKIQRKLHSIPPSTGLYSECIQRLCGLWWSTCSTRTEATDELCLTDSLQFS